MTHSDETKAAVLAALLAGQSVSSVAEQFHVTRPTVQRWRDAAGLNTVSVINHEKKDVIGELLIDYLRESLTTLAAQQQYFRDPDWIRKQSAADAAVLHGVIADKAYKLAGALEYEQPGDPDTPLATLTPADTEP